MGLSDKLDRLSPEQRTQLALQLSSAKLSSKSSEAADLPQILPDARNCHEPFPLSDLQEAYLVGRSEGIELGNISCHGYGEVDVKDWDRERFEAVLNKLIARHAMLRCIVTPEGQQKILPATAHYNVQINDLCNLGEAAAASRLDSIRAEMSHKVHAADQWPLFEISASLLNTRYTRLHFGLDLLIMDGRSIEIFFRELARLYDDPEVVLPPLETSFRDYLLALASAPETHKFREARKYWINRIETLPPSPELPLAMNPSSVSRPFYKRRTARLDASLWRNLKEKAAAIQSTPSGILLSAYAEVLAIWSKSPRFTLNLTLFNRLPLHPQINDVIGDFTSVNLLEVDNSKSESFSIRSQQLQERLWQDLDRGEFSGIQMLRELSRHQGVGPKAIAPVVFTSLLNLGNQNDGETWCSRLGECVYLISQTPQVYLDFIVSEEKDSLLIHWDAVEEIFPLGLLNDMFGAYQSLLNDLATDESSWDRALVDNARRLIPASQLETRKRANATHADLPDELLHTPFIWQVSERPSQIAVCSPTCRLTYRDVYDRACRIEEELLRRGVQPNQMVAVLMEKGWEQVVAVLGILFAGGAYLPIDSELPAERQRYLIEHGGVKVVLTQSSLQHALDVPKSIDVLAVDLLDPSDYGAPALRRRQKPEDLAYVIYTSGSTGLPKGVMIDHRGAMNTVLDINQRFAIGPQDRVLALSRLNFDLSVYDIFGLLSAGGTVVMPAAHLAQDVTHWAQLVAAEKVTVWNTVPALMQLMTDEAADGDGIGHSLRLILMSGDWIPVSLPGQIRRILPDARIISLGGATEASIWSILYPVEHVEPNWTSIPYGKPMLNQTFQVLSPQQGPCPVWVPGQLYIGGVGVAKGYWHDEQKTNASFVSDAVTRERLYRTGDMGRYLPDGNIEFLGREDFQVKVQGYRIELGEIEALLQRHEGVENCAVTVREDRPGEKRLVGYAVRKTGLHLSSAELREYLRAKLPEYMVPATLVFMDRFPITPNGKVDRKALPAPVHAFGQSGSPSASPRDELEARLSNLWAKILGIHPVGLRDSFFELGGSSLMAVRLFSELRKQFGKNLSLSSLFHAPTTEQMAELLRNDGWAPSWSSLVPIETGGSKPPFFCVHGAGGNVLMFKALASHMAPNYPFYALQAQGLDGGKEYISTVEEMAERYLKEIRELQPEGPYHLGGFCLGGQVAFEMAQQLRQRGQQVALLAMIDTYNFQGVPPQLTVRESLETAGQKFFFHSRNILRLRLKQQLNYLGKKIKIASYREYERMWTRITSFLRVGQYGKDNQYVNLERLNEDAHFAYVARQYPNDVTIFKPRRSFTFAADPQLGWGDVISPNRLEIVDLPADPGGIFIEPYVQTLAEKLMERIDGAVVSHEESIVSIHS